MPASRCAVSRTSAIMLGMPCVRFDDNSRVRSNGASSAAMSAVGDLGGGLVLDRGQDQRDDALGDRGIAVGEEMQPPVGAAGSDRPTPTPNSRAPWSRRS